MANRPYFDPVNSKINFPELEEKVLADWNKNNTFKKSVENKKGKKRFVFYDGPPTANGKPGVHHVEARAFKDLIPRFKTMQGFYCERKAGWDCHGLPVEIEVEKKLGISGKPQIEDYGIDKFCDLCRKSVYEYVDEWKKLTSRIGFWIDMDNSYETLTNSYIETGWWILKQIWDKGFMYEDYKVVPYCARCGTSLSSHELAQGYKDKVKDPAIYIKFKVVGKEDTYFIAWTTTPWTLPGNVALAVAPNEIYVEVKENNQSYIMAKSRIEAVGVKGKVIKEFKGKELVNTEYEPLYSFIKYDKKAFYVVTADFVAMEEGSGIVHTAVMYGEDDFELGKKFDLPKKHLVNEKGEFIKEVTPWAGMFVKKTNEPIIEDLKKRELIYKRENILHTYPFCWRCGTPLLYYALTSWYLKTTAVKDDLIKNNRSVNWVPEHIKEGRMGEWLAGNRDWAISRSRYWGTPMPIWRCHKCNHTIPIGSVAELEKLTGNDLSKLDLHRPYIDEVTFKCEKCQGEMKRLPFVLDCWFDSGAMPYGQLHYPFENENEFKNKFPADYICEALDQTRGWFYTLQAVSTLLENGTAYKNAICLGLALDEKGNKMSKSKGNVIDPWEVANTVGVDAMRWYFYSVISPGESFRFSVNLVSDVNRRFVMLLWNIYSFFVIYANLDNWTPLEKSKIKNQKSKLSGLDNWILTRLDQLVGVTTEKLESYSPYGATIEIESFLQDLSTWYVRRSRDRVGPAAADEKDKQAFYSTCYQCLTTLCKIIAPFTPFTADAIYTNLTKEESVHLTDWPSINALPAQADKLLEDMEEVRKVVEKIHAARKMAGIPVSQALAKVTVSGSDFSEELLQLIKDEVNIKDIEFIKGEEKVELDTKITPELEEEAKARKLIRRIQEERKNMGMDLTQKADVVSDWLPEDKRLRQRIILKALINKLTLGEFTVKKI
jgi:isoleucyl-tRNA synthetase